MTLEQLLADVTRAAETLPAIQPQHGVIEVKFHKVHASPDDVAEQLAAALPDWPTPEITALPPEETRSRDATAWIEMKHQNMRIVAFIDQKKTDEYMGTRGYPKAA